MTATCMCQLKVSKVNKWVMMPLTSRLNDEVTTQEALSKVKEMMLNDTIARETGKNSMKILNV